MYEYFGVGPKIREEVNDIYPRYLRWLPKYRLSMPSRHSLEIWCMVIDNLTIDDVSLVIMVWPLSHSRFFCDFSDAFESLGWM